IAADRPQVQLDEIKGRLDGRLVPLGEAEGIGIDVGVIAESKLRRSPCLVMWYDMRFGHKTILGDASYVPALRQFSLDRVPAWDVRNLLVNRGTLLVINAVMLERPELAEEERRTVIKHGMKAVIGYGDACLYGKGAYDWSYVEKRRRMRERSDVPGTVRALYDEAAAFRFEPAYDRYLAKDLVAWNRALLEALAPVHLDIERHRLGDPSLTWESYAAAAFEHALTEGWTSPRALAKKGVALFQTRTAPSAGSLLGSVGFRMSRARERLPILFPAVAYEGMPASFSELAHDALGAASTRLPNLRRAYLKAWGDHGDTNFHAVLRTLRIDLTQHRSEAR
ncbi:MAG: hypothetical protein KC417_00475, partial [Myxococcales bacterium]|nr:hypothetical protein [Myxococcales bacterium]